MEGNGGTVVPAQATSFHVGVQNAEEDDGLGFWRRAAQNYVPPQQLSTSSHGEQPECKQQ